MQNPFKYPIHAGTLSFLLPGLGQLHQKRILPAIALFLLYITILAQSEYRVWILLPMALAAWDAQRQRNQSFQVWNVRTFAFFAVGMVAFVSAFSLMAEKVLPFPQIGKMSFVANALADEIRLCARANHALPTRLEDCAGIAARWRSDPWGKAFRYEAMPPGFEIRSVGRDGKDKTDDDFIYRFRSPLR